MTGQQVETEELRKLRGGMRLFADYDALRLSTYREKEWLEDRIRVGSIGTATALRFDDVGYFNRIYAPDESILDRLEEVEDYYRGSWHGCELLCAAEREFSPARPGWTSGTSYAWLHASPVPSTTLPPAGETMPGEIVVRAPEPGERVLFLETYLRAFEASEEGMPAAIRNMRHLFTSPRLSFLMALVNDQPVGIGMLYRRGTTAALCAGACLPGHRRQGYHRALVEARLRLAAEAGCTEIVSWAVAGGASHQSMEKAGLQTVGVTTAWKLAPASLTR
jgi:GNAT superfamily N-acetyltransferase